MIGRLLPTAWMVHFAEMHFLCFVIGILVVGELSHAVPLAIAGSMVGLQQLDA
jgi:hypothetical protein